MGLRAGLDWCGKSRLTGIRSPDRPARRQSLYRLRYPAHLNAICPVNITLLLALLYCIILLCFTTLNFEDHSAVMSTYCCQPLISHIDHSSQQFHNSKCVIFQENLLKVLKCYNAYECNDDTTALQRRVLQTAL